MHVQFNNLSLYYTNEAVETGRIIEGLFVDSEYYIQYEGGCEILEQGIIQELLDDNGNVYRDRYGIKANKTIIIFLAVIIFSFVPSPSINFSFSVLNICWVRNTKNMKKTIVTKNPNAYTYEDFDLIGSNKVIFNCWLISYWL